MFDKTQSEAGIWSFATWTSADSVLWWALTERWMLFLWKYKICWCGREVNILWWLQSYRPKQRIFCDCVWVFSLLEPSSFWLEFLLHTGPINVIVNGNSTRACDWHSTGRKASRVSPGNHPATIIYLRNLLSGSRQTEDHLRSHLRTPGDERHPEQRLQRRSQLRPVL